MITLYAVPKPFDARNRRPQDNALASWRAILPGAQIILFGDEEGIEEAARRHGVEHAPVVRNEHGTPLLDHVFAEARRRAVHPLLGYVNADILFTSELAKLVPLLASLPWHRHLTVGRRVDLDFTEILDVGSSDWESRLRGEAATRGRLHETTGIDYMLFPRSWSIPMPSFPVGRVLWDNWLIHEARRTDAPVIDATAAVLAVHQNHDYAHLGGARAAGAAAEVARNWALVGPDFLPLTIADATYELRAGEVLPRRSLGPLLRRALVAPALTPGLRRSVRVARAVYRWLRPPR